MDGTRLSGRPVGPSGCGFLPHLFAVLADVRVDLIEGTQHVELHGMQAGLLGEVGVHVLVADGGELGDVCIVSAGERTGSLVRGSAKARLSVP